MDGYAVCGDLQPGEYTVQDIRLHAGVNAAQYPLPGSDYVAYITTGSMVPEGANAVVKIEDTTAVDIANDSQMKEKKVRIDVVVPVGSNIRQIGSDIQAGEVILQKGSVIAPAEIGLLATVGVMSVPCYRKPVVGVMSTGSELVNPWETPTGSQIRDSNRATLLAAFQQDLGNAHCIDLGIVKDSARDLEAALLSAAERCDVVVTSGGVSMGDADLVKPMLEKLGSVHFGRLNMKPGKPTTFATLKSKRADGQDKTVLFFGLPGNPVSCLVTKTLFIDPAVRRLQGMDSLSAMHPQVTVQLEAPLAMDPERPEYHRAILDDAGSRGGPVVARSTGNQRSSRLMSMKSANALLCLPQGSGTLPAGSHVPAIITGPFLPPTKPALCYHRAAAAVDFPEQAAASSASSQEVGLAAKYQMRVGLLTISDRASQGVYADDSGPEMQKMLLAIASGATGPLAAPAMGWPLEPVIQCTAIVPDDPAAIEAVVLDWADAQHLDLILTSGGTGFGQRDLTPETIRPLLHREAPGVAQALLNEGLKHTPLAVLSRPVVGTRGNTLICTLPGSVKAVRENIVALGPLLPRIMELIASGSCFGKGKH
jgi:gephyrin